MPSKPDYEISFEFFPPKNENGFSKLQSTAKVFAELNPEFFSVTYGAGGSIQEKTIETALELKESTNVNVAPHLTCIGMSKSKIRNILNDYENNSINRIIALRGDLPPNVELIENELQYAVDLVKFIRENNGDFFHIDVAAYPEIHPQSATAKQDIRFFKEKIDAGANGAITQYFYNIDAYKHFLDCLEKEQIDIPVVPGIMPIYGVEQIERFSNSCGAEIPRWLKKEIESLEHDNESVIDYGIEVVSKLCQDLLDINAPGLHFYSLNRSDVVLKIYENLTL